jgi:hypothetical protein
MFHTYATIPKATPMTASMPTLESKVMILGVVIAPSTMRVSELTGLYGKGRRERPLPLWKVPANALRAWIAVRGTARVRSLTMTFSRGNAQGCPRNTVGTASRSSLSSGGSD